MSHLNETRYPLFVIPAKAGIQFLVPFWMPACAGMTISFRRHGVIRQDMAKFAWGSETGRGVFRHPSLLPSHGDKSRGWQPTAGHQTEIAVRVLGEAAHIHNAAPINTVGMSWREARSMLSLSVTKGLEINAAYLGDAAWAGSWKLLAEEIGALTEAEHYKNKQRALLDRLEPATRNLLEKRAEAKRRHEQAEKSAYSRTMTRAELDIARQNRNEARVASEKADAAAKVAVDHQTLAEFDELDAQRKLHETRLTEWRVKPKRMAVLGKLSSGVAYSAFNGAMAWGLLSYFGSEMERAELFGDEGDKKKAKAMYYAASANMAATVTDLARYSAGIAQARNWPWAAGLIRWILRSKVLMWVSRGGGSVVSYGFAVNDLVKAGDLWDDGRIGWSIAYYISVILNGASGATVMRGKTGTPWAPYLLFGTAAYTMTLYSVSPTELELWLSRCYFGQRPTEDWTDSHWGRELTEFSMALQEKPPEDKVLKNQMPTDQQFQGRR